MSLAKKETISNPKEPPTYEDFSVVKLMEEIRAKVEKDIELNKDRPLQFNPFLANADNQVKAGELLYSEELKFLNQNWAYSNQARARVDQITSHRWGFIGRLIVKIKKKIAVSIWDSILKPYFEQEKEFQANLVRFLNQTSKYVDQRDAGNFWELIRKIDVDITNTLERIERIRDEQCGDIRGLEKRFFESISQLAKEVCVLNENYFTLKQQQKTLESVALGLEKIVARASRLSKTSSTESDQPILHFQSDQSYLLLENRFRGSFEEIKDRVSIYPSQFENIYNKTLLPVLEIGGGRGELQALFKEAKINSYSVDIDRAMVEAGKELGLNVLSGDGLQHLGELKDDSLSGVIAIQVVEHLNQDQLKTLFRLCNKKVISGGIVIFETINPQSVLALSSNYFRDPTHVWPLHPDTLSFQMNLYGLETLETRFLSPISSSAGIETIPETTAITPLWKDVIFRINRNFTRLHDLLFGYQDYCIIAKVKDKSNG